MNLKCAMSGTAAAPLSTFYLQTTPIWRDYTNLAQAKASFIPTGR